MGSCCTKSCNCLSKNNESSVYQKERHMDSGSVFKRVEKAIITTDDTGATTINEYRIGEQLHRVKNSNYRLCLAEDTHLKVQRVIKIAPKSLKIASSNEVKVLKLIDHPNVIKLLEVIIDPRQPDSYLIFEYCEGGPLLTIDSKGNANRSYSEVQTRAYLVQIASALSYIHSRDIIHCTLRPENMLLCKERRTLKLSDFQKSQIVGENDCIRVSSDKATSHSFYMAPEEFAGKLCPGRASDIWAMGVVLYAMIFGKVPFVGPSADAAMTKDVVMQGELVFAKEPSNLNANLKQLIKRILEKDLLIRITLNEILDDTWVTDGGIWQGPNGLKQPATTVDNKPELSAMEQVRAQAREKKAVQERVLGRHILVVEDVFLVRELVVRMFQSIILPKEGEEINVDCVMDGDEAVLQVKKKQYALVFMDIHMSRMSGLDATLQIRDWESANNIQPCVIIGLTGDVAEQITEVSTKVGMNEVALKPLRPEQARAIAQRYGLQVHYDKAFDVRQLGEKVGKNSAYLGAYVRHLQNNGEVVQLDDTEVNREAGMAFLACVMRGALPLEANLHADLVELICSEKGFLGMQPSLTEEPDVIPGSVSDHALANKIILVDSQQVTSGHNLDRFVTKRAENVRTGLDTFGKKFINEYTMLDELGTGTYGTVYRTVNTRNDQIYAMKIANKRQLAKSVGSFRLEVEILQAMTHPNVIKIFEVIDDPKSKEVYFVLEYIDGGSIATVDGVGNVSKRYSENEARKMMVQVIEGLEYLHGHNILHQDIKPDNILKHNSTNLFKLSDFGVSNYLKSGDDSVTTAKGTPIFSAPEACKGAGEVFSGKAADIWALGVTLYALIYRQVPFVVQSQFQLYNDIQTKAIVYPEKPKISDDLRVLLVRMLEKDVLLRITGPEIRDHPFLTGKANMIRKVARHVSKKKVGRTDGGGAAIEPNMSTDWEGVRHILIVEDIFVIRRVITKIFDHVLLTDEKRQVKIDCVADGEEAINACKETRYSIILMDVHMPKKSGFDATLQIRDMEIDNQWPRAAIVGQTADIHANINEVCMQVGMDDVVQKPLTPAVLTRICTRYGFPVQGQTQIPKGLFGEEGHSFTNSLQAYIDKKEGSTNQANVSTMSSPLSSPSKPQPRPPNPMAQLTSSASVGDIQLVTPKSPSEAKFTLSRNSSHTDSQAATPRTGGVEGPLYKKPKFVAPKSPSEARLNLSRNSSHTDSSAATPNTAPELPRTFSDVSSTTGSNAGSPPFRSLGRSSSFFGLGGKSPTPSMRPEAIPSKLGASSSKDSLPLKSASLLAATPPSGCPDGKRLDGHRFQLQSQPQPHQQPVIVGESPTASPKPEPQAPTSTATPNKNIPNSEKSPTVSPKSGDTNPDAPQPKKPKFDCPLTPTLTRDGSQAIPSQRTSVDSYNSENSKTSMGDTTSATGPNAPTISSSLGMTKTPNITSGSPVFRPPALSRNTSCISQTKPSSPAAALRSNTAQERRQSQGPHGGAKNGGGGSPFPTNHPTPSHNPSIPRKLPPLGELIVATDPEHDPFSKGKPLSSLCNSRSQSENSLHSLKGDDKEADSQPLQPSPPTVGKSEDKEPVTPQTPQAVDTQPHPTDTPRQDHGIKCISKGHPHGSAMSPPMSPQLLRQQADDESKASDEAKEMPARIESVVNIDRGGSMPKATDGPKEAPYLPRSMFKGSKKVSRHLHTVLKNEVIPFIQTTIVNEIQKNHEGNKLLCDDEVAWVRDKVEKLNAQVHAKVPAGGRIEFEESDVRGQVYKGIQAEIDDMDIDEMMDNDPNVNQWKGFMATECGKRDTQVDTCICIRDLDTFGWELANTTRKDTSQKMGFVALFDGHMGRACSEYSRNMMHHYLLAALQEGNDIPEAIGEAFKKTHNGFKEKANKANSDAGCTAVVSVLLTSPEGVKKIYLANLGDSRAILCTGTEAVALTHDHKPYNDDEKQRIEAAGGTVVHNAGAWRVNGVLTVSRAIASVRDCQPYLSSTPELTVHNVEDADYFMVVASDGLWNVMSNGEVVAFILEGIGEIKSGIAEDPDEAPSLNEGYQLIADALCAHAIEELNSDDNVTVAIIVFRDV